MNYSELKSLAEACGDLHWRAIQENWCEWAIRDDHAYIAIMRTKSAKHPGPCPDRESKVKFLCAVTPSVVLSLIAENEINAEKFKEWQASHHANYCMVADERDQLKAENEALRKDAERYRLIRSESAPDSGLIPEFDGANWTVTYLDNGAGGLGGGVCNAVFDEADKAFDFAMSKAAKK